MLSTLTTKVKNMRGVQDAEKMGRQIWCRVVDGSNYGKSGDRSAKEIYLYETLKNYLQLSISVNVYSIYGYSFTKC